MKAAILTPHFFPEITGNSVTVSRLAKGLAARGVEVEIVNTGAVRDPVAVLSRLRNFAPRVLHGLNAFKTGELLLDLGRELALPMALTVTGTDAYQNLSEEKQRDRVLRVLRSVQGIIVFHEAVRSRLNLVAPEVAERLVVIPQAVDLPEGVKDPLQGIPARPDRFRFLVASGIRPVKNVASLLAPCAQVVREFPQVELVVAGPILDPQAGEAFRKQIASLPWAHFLGPVPHDQMRTLYGGVDVVVNSSLSEGGMANTLLEAMSLGLPVLASRIEGNATIVEEGVNGLLYSGPEEFRTKAARLITDPVLRRRLGEAGREFIQREFPPEREVSGYLRLYRKLTEEIP